MQLSWENLVNQWELMDVFKTICSLLAGLILGVERELKDKSAGLKTISIICLGSTLFTLLSYKIGQSESEDATRIASYVVSGIGFLGAGVIFKDGLNVNGMTTASIIWVSAAIGMAIGFGEFAIAVTFLISCFFILHTGRFMSKLLFSHKTTKQLWIQIPRMEVENKDLIYKEIKENVYKASIKRIEANDETINILLEVVLLTKSLPQFEEQLFNDTRIKGFKM